DRDAALQHRTGAGTTCASTTALGYPCRHFASCSWLLHAMGPGSHSGVFMSAIPATPSKSRSFSTVFLIEMWERFGYYGMQALIVYYMVQRLGFPDEKANLVWSAAAALIYVAPAIGGWVGDKVLGTRRT